MKKKILNYLMLATLMGMVVACSKNDPAPANPGNGDDDPKPGVEGISGDLSAIDFQANETYLVVGNLEIPQGKSVTIPEGVRLEFDLGPNNQRWTLDVKGSLYVKGTANNRVVFTASEDALASRFNTGTGGLWGGIIGTSLAGDIVLEYADIMHGGGPAKEGDAITTSLTGGSGRASVGEDTYMLYYCRPAGERQDGVFILNHCHIAYTMDDAIRTNGGKTLMMYNTFEVIGRTGGEAVNIKAGGPGDFAFNLFYNIATNSLKSADTQSGERGLLETNFYNNTIVNSGYRRVERARGGSLNYEANAYGKAYNNLIVNNRYGLRLPLDDRPDMERLLYGYNWYYGSVDAVTSNFYPTGEDDPSRGVIGVDPAYPIPASDVLGGPKENDPLFVNYDVASFAVEFTSGGDNNNLADNVDGIPADADFRLQAGSPAATGAFTGFQPVFAEYITLTGEVFTAPQPQAYFGAFAPVN
ncbi:hypothetical protein SAMN05421747_10146 [Parapedobacter composti]|uniref:Right handed beta helix region n=1 Tax=Parapedobacter composti TaxID=623281 RepID=A0A1I1DS42_9SPHI|nr:hypothetical protein [Parapedobacter composti]SFB77805.1 hypothetical protein SAMN05421747_10146 [Parapedobacter composti]